jgi:hypothetical protein
MSLATDKAEEKAVKAEEKAERAAVKVEEKAEAKAQAKAEAKPRCAICAAFVDEPGQEGECRRHAPRITGMGPAGAAFPKIHDNSWCFEFVPMK